MRIAGFLKNSVVDGPGQRAVLLVQGCSHNCLGCKIPDIQNVCFGHSESIEEIASRFDKVDNIIGVSISGGEPFDQALECAKLIIEIKHRHPDYKVWTFTGYTFEEIQSSTNYVWELLLDVTDVLVDGPYVAAKKTSELKYRQSSNQRLIDVNSSRRAKKIVEYRLFR